MAKYVATSDFRNPDVEKIDVGSDKIHELHVHKGARFTIGGELTFEKMTAADKRLVSELNTAGRIVSIDQKEVVDQIDKEVAADKKKAKAAEAASEKK